MRQVLALGVRCAGSHRADRSARLLRCGDHRRRNAHSERPGRGGHGDQQPGLVLLPRREAGTLRAGEGNSSWLCPSMGASERGDSRRAAAHRVAGEHARGVRGCGVRKAELEKLIAELAAPLSEEEAESLLGRNSALRRLCRDQRTERFLPPVPRPRGGGNRRSDGAGGLRRSAEKARTRPLSSPASSSIVVLER